MPPGEITQLLAQVSRGSRRAMDQLLPRIYDELRRLAGHYLRDERADHTLQPTALVHEAYLRLVGTQRQAFESRAHFFRLAALAMRRVLVDHARRHRAARRGGGQRKLSLTQAPEAGVPPDLDLLALDEALTRLAGIDPHKGRVVELRFFGGLTVEEVGSALGVSSRTVARDWRLARAWLFRELNTAEGTPPSSGTPPPE